MSSNSRLVVDEDDNGKHGKFRLERVNMFREQYRVLLQKHIIPNKHGKQNKECLSFYLKIRHRKINKKLKE